MTIRAQYQEQSYNETIVTEGLEDVVVDVVLNTDFSLENFARVSYTFSISDSDMPNLAEKRITCVGKFTYENFATQEHLDQLLRGLRDWTADVKYGVSDKYLKNTLLTAIEKITQTVIEDAKQANLNVA